MQTEDIEYFGTRFRVVVPASIGLPKHTTHEFKDHEPVMERWVYGIRSGDLVIDAGAQFGNYALPALYKGACAVCYEPCTENAIILRANVQANNFSAIIREIGLWNGTPYPEGILRQICMPLGMPTVRLDDEWLSGNLPTGSGGRVHIKLDIEGTELGAIQGGMGFISKYHPKIVIENHEGVSADPLCEVSRHPERVSSSVNIRKLLEGLGYVIDIVPFDVSRFYWVCE
jgi:hypothetical protein